jgi:hypothetical protein
MVETSIKVNEKLSKKGKTLGEVSKEEFCDIVREASS